MYIIMYGANKAKIMTVASIGMAAAHACQYHQHQRNSVMAAAAAAKQAKSGGGESGAAKWQRRMAAISIEMASA